jgi:hypothetical protein
VCVRVDVFGYHYLRRARGIVTRPVYDYKEKMRDEGSVSVCVCVNVWESFRALVITHTRTHTRTHITH